MEPQNNLSSLQGDEARVKARKHHANGQSPMKLSRIFFALSITVSVAQAETIFSPNKEIRLEVGLDSSTPYYRVSFDGIEVVGKSSLGLAAESDATTNESDQTIEGWTRLHVARQIIDETWKPVVGKRAVVRNQCEQLTLALGRSTGNPLRMNLIFRTFDEGIAFRYVIEPDTDAGRTIRITHDHSEFAFTGDHQVWSYQHERRPLGPDRMTDLNENRGYPVVMKSDKDYWIALAEAALTGMDYFDVVFSGQGTTARLHVDTSVVQTPFSTPWRVLMISRNPADFLDSDLLANLSSPPAGNFSWVRPGLSLWDWRVWGFVASDGFEYEMGFESWKRMIDFAHKKEIPYLLLDANWYGPEHSDLSNPFQGGLAAQVKRALEYGKEMDVGLILYLNDAASKNFEIEKICEAYARWGAAGIKYGFMKGSGQDKVLKTERVVKACAENRLLVNFHDGPIPPTGHERTWPNWNTREYIHAQTDGHRTHLPGDFVHMAYVQALAGPVDGNHGLFDYESPGPERPPQFGGLYSTIVAEIARTLILYSGLTVLPDAPEAYAEHPGLFGFVGAQKQPWQQSRTLQGEFGKWITSMRQAVDGNFLVATATDEEGRKVEVSLGFLPDGRFEATVFEDAEDAHYRTNRVAYNIRTQVVTSDDVIQGVLAPGGGHAVLLRPLP